MNKIIVVAEVVRRLCELKLVICYLSGRFGELECGDWLAGWKVVSTKMW